MQGKLPPLSLGCQTARRRWPGVPWEIFCGYKPIWFYWFISCLSHCSEVSISCYMGLRYNTTLVISFMNVMPVLWHVGPTCVCVCVCDMRSWWDVVREKIDRVKTVPHCNWLNALSTTSWLVVARIANINYKTMHPSHHSETEWVDCQSTTDIRHNHTCIIHTSNVPRSELASSRQC